MSSRISTLHFLAARRAVADSTSVRQDLDKILEQHNDPRLAILKLTKMYKLNSSSLAEAASGGWTSDLRIAN